MYEYKIEKPKIFTEEGQKMFLKIRDHIEKCLKLSGAVDMGCAIAGNTGDTWEMMACVDRLVELGELQEILQNDPAGQHRIFIKVR